MLSWNYSKTDKGLGIGQNESAADVQSQMPNRKKLGARSHVVGVCDRRFEAGAMVSCREKHALSVANAYCILCYFVRRLTSLAVWAPSWHAY